MGVPTKRLSGKLFYTHHLVPNIDFKTLTIMRSSQAIAIAFLFVPISTVAFSRLPPEKSNAASALFNLSRNLGASFGIALVINLVVRQSQVHTNLLVSHVTNGNPIYAQWIAGLTQRLVQQGASTYDAGRQAAAVVARVIAQQAGALAYLDAFRFVAIACFVMLPLGLLIKRVRPGGGPVHME